MSRKSHYSRIVIEGFQSCAKPLSFNLDRLGVNLIKGTNGVGKSTLFNALLWAEYGYNLKKSVATWEDKRPDNFRGTRVVVERTDGEFDYMVARHLGFKGTTKGITGGDKLMLFKKSVDEPTFTDKHLVGDGLHKSDMQLLIQEQIGLDVNTFVNSIIFGQRVASLVEATNADKRKLFEEMFDLSFVDNAKEKAKLEKDKVDADIYKISKDIENAEHNLKKSEDYYEEQKETLTTFTDKKNQRVSDAEKVVSDLSVQLEELETKRGLKKKELEKFDTSKLDAEKEKLDTLKNAYREEDNNRTGSERRVKDLIREVSKAGDNIVKLEQDLTNVEDTCPYCSGKLDAKKVEETKKAIKDKIKKEKEVVKELENQKKQEDKNLEKLAASVKKLSDEYDAQQGIVNSISKGLEGMYSLKQELSNLETNITNTTNNLKSAKDRLETEKSEMPPKIDLKKTEQDIQNYKDLIESGSEKVQELSSKSSKIDWWLKKGFGAGGLKAFVFNAMLNQLNLYAQKYANRLGFRVEFTVDMTKANKPFQTLIYKGDKVRDYEDLSGGQRQRVDVCVAFAMYDLVSHKSDINILLMDEVFEGLDVAGVEVCLELIRDQAQTKSVYVITHNEAIDVLNCKSIYVELDEDENTMIV